MTTVTVKINTNSNKAKYLLGLITELSKTDKDIKILEESDIMKSFEQSFIELDQARRGELRLKNARNIIPEL